jgi:uncharacterized membrane protein
MGVMMLLVWLPIVLVPLWALGMLRGRAPRDGDAAVLDAREIARRAYARGEIDRARFLQLIEDLDRPERGGTAQLPGVPPAPPRSEG